MTYTRDEIGAMTDDELRLAIADLKGYRKFVFGNRGYVENHSTFIPKEADVVDQFPTSITKITIYTPDWPRDIAAAWKLLEELRNEFFSTNIIMWDYGDTVCIIFHPRQGHGENLPDMQVEANGMPRAIAEAYLLWKQTQGE